MFPLVFLISDQLASKHVFWLSGRSKNTQSLLRLNLSYFHKKLFIFMQFSLAFLCRDRLASIYVLLAYWMLGNYYNLAFFASGCVSRLVFFD